MINEGFIPKKKKNLKNCFVHELKIMLEYFSMLFGPWQIKLLNLNKTRSIAKLSYKVDDNEEMGWVTKIEESRKR